MLELIHVTKRFGELKAVDDLSFAVEKGEVFGIAGPNGAGKSTVYNLITGFYPCEGEIRFHDGKINGLPPFRIAKLGITRTFQTPKTFPSLTLERSIAVGSRFGSKIGYDAGRVDELIRFLGLEDEKGELTDSLNLLGKKKLMMGAALATEPEVLMLDEPMAGSNAGEIKELMDLIQSINRDMGVTIIIIEHFMKVLTELTDKPLIIESGSQIAFGDPVEVTAHPEVIECYLGDAYAHD